MNKQHIVTDSTTETSRVVSGVNIALEVSFFQSTHQNGSEKKTKLLYYFNLMHGHGKSLVLVHHERIVL